MNLRGLALLCLMFAPLAQAATADAALAKFFDNVKTLSAHFEQVQHDDKGSVTQASSGRLWLARPEANAAADTQGKFRWSYQKPYQQLMVCDGEKIWLYDPDLTQVSVRPAAATLAGTPAQLLSRKSALKEEFIVEDGGKTDGVQTVRLKPRSADSDFKAIELALRDGAPIRMVFFDQLGDTSEITFSDLKINAPIADSLFSFTPPKGTEVIEAEPAGAALR